jgi:hypothetical protein
LFSGVQIKQRLKAKVEGTGEKNPGQGLVRAGEKTRPPNAKIRKWKDMERYGYGWIWMDMEGG